MDTSLGVAVIGVGIAGGVRIRDIIKGEYLNNVILQGFVSRRTIEKEGATQITEEAALQSPDVHAIIVCTENVDHERIIRLALEADKHVLVEFPLVVDFGTVNELYDLAKVKGVVLYEENIALLTPQHIAIKQAVNPKKAKLVKAAVSLEGSIRGNNLSEYLSRTGHPLYSAVSLLQRLMDILGDMSPVSANMDLTDTTVEVTAKLSTDTCNDIEIRISRAKTETFKRVTSCSYSFDDRDVIDGSTVPSQTQASGPGLFLQDLILFADVVRGKRDNSYNEWITRRSLQITSELIGMIQ